MNSLAGDIFASIEDLSGTKVLPWLKTGSVFFAKLMLEFISKKFEVQIAAFVLPKDFDFKKIDELDLESVIDVEKIELNRGMPLSKVSDLITQLKMAKEKKVWQEGEYSQVGDVITLWPYGFENPVRLDIESDKVGSMSIVDADTRRTVENIENLLIRRMPKLSEVGIGGDSVDEVEAFIVGESFSKSLSRPVVISPQTPLLGEIYQEIKEISLGTEPSEWDKSKIAKLAREGWNIQFVINWNLDQAQEIKEEIPEISIFEEEFAEGFESKSLGLVVLTDQELWGTVKIDRSVRKAKSVDFIEGEINPGDYVVHEDHGVALYNGIKEVETSSGTNKYLELKYAQKDRLLVPFNVVEKITKYIGVKGRQPVLTRLGGGEWKRVKNRVKKNLAELASKLLHLYAARELTSVSSPDLDEASYRKFENDFEFVETEDQARAVDDVLEDLRGDRPMDRLLVGDVGFGKTEVAMRAAFVTVLGNRQVALLAPTTILVEQHYHVLKNRMEKHGVRVEALSRFLSNEDSKRVIEDIKSGKVDVVIGTHRLLSKDVEFKNLGLLIVDEEQKFGVSQKEKLKRARVDVHVLSLTATPIPRTLNMALSGVRDISVIATPPIGRKPIKNIVKKFEWGDVEDAIKNEVSRGGQVYFVHNRVSSIENVKLKLEERLPGVRFSVGHGQMSPEKLSRVMRDFNERKNDVLICSTIIENGLDMPNVNTLIVDRSEMFGLAQLYQLRGRIGRGDRQAYAYFFYAGPWAGRVVKQAYLEDNLDESKVESPGILDKDDEAKGLLWHSARQRLDAIMTLEELGSGFGLAQRDLEIRGAGNFLGKEQHGSVSAVGFSLYCRLLGEMVERMKKERKAAVKG